MASPEGLGISMMVDQNPRYCPVTATTILVENTAESVTYRKEAATSRSTSSLAFTIELSDQFNGRDMFINWDKIPITISRPTAVTGVNEVNFHSKFLDSYKTLTMTQFGLLNAIDNLTVSIDGRNIASNRSDEIMQQISRYYDPDEVHRHFDCSNPNIYYCNDVPETNPWIPSVDTRGGNIAIKGSSLSENDPFSATVGDGFNSRCPALKFDKISTDGKTIEVELNSLSTWLPFNLLGINGDTSPLYFGQRMSININLHPNWVSRIFQTRRLPGTKDSPFTFALNNKNWGGSNPGDIFINYKQYQAPQYIRNALDARTDKYIQKYSVVEQDTSIRDYTFAADTSTISFASHPIDLRAIPKRVYQALVNKRTTDSEYLTDAIHFCRFDSMSVELNGTTTNLAPANSAEQLYYIAKANGLSMNKQQALYTVGFPMCIDVSDNLGCASNSYVGLSTRNSSGKYTLRTWGTATRLHHDTETADFRVHDIAEDKVAIPPIAADPITKEKFWKRYAKTYELRTIVVYAGFFVYKMTGSTFDIIESLTQEALSTMNLHIDNLKQNFAPNMNILGGSWISSLAPTLKNVGKGVFNVIKAAITNKNGLRDSLERAYKNEYKNDKVEGGRHMAAYNVGGKPLDDWGG